MNAANRLASVVRSAWRALLRRRPIATPERERGFFERSWRFLLLPVPDPGRARTRVTRESVTVQLAEGACVRIHAPPPHSIDRPGPGLSPRLDTPEFSAACEAVHARARAAVTQPRLLAPIIVSTVASGAVVAARLTAGADGERRDDHLIAIFPPAAGPSLARRPGREI